MLGTNSFGLKDLRDGISWTRRLAIVASRHGFRILALSVVAGMLLAGFGCSVAVAGEGAGAREAAEALALMAKVRDYQRAHPYRPADRNWIRATYYTGLMAMYRATKDPEILAQATRWAEKHEWREGSERLPANKKTCGQTYLELYFIKPEAKRIAPIRRFVDQRMARIAAGESPLVGWGYVDTLYVGPPTIAMLAKATGDAKYTDYLNEVYWTVADRLFDKKHGLFYRDKRFFKAKTSRGRKVFWSRGNGWAFAGIPRVLTYLPRDNKFRPRYLKLYRAMAAALVACQGADGLWRSNLADPDQHPNPETSGTAFFCYGLAWGVNEGLLDKAVYLPAVVKAWNGLRRHVHPDGKLGFVQRVAGSPGGATAGDTHEYAMGAFLLAGSEMVRLFRSDISLSAADLLRASSAADPQRKAEPRGAVLPEGIKLFARNGGWCWFQDPRAIIHGGKLIAGSVSGSGATRGDVRASVYDLKANKNLGTFVLHSRLQSDDHDAPAFYVRPDKRILAVYARHSASIHYYRISEPNDPTKWGPMQTFKHPHRITYMNLYYHVPDDTLYNFYRDTGGTYCPAYLTSKDHGTTWRRGGQLIFHGMKGRHRPYARYGSDGEYIHVSFTESHPQEFKGSGCSIYYAKFKAGKFYRADGTFIKDIQKEGPLLPKEAETIFKADSQNSAWTSSIVTDAAGRVYIAYSVRKSPADHRFRYARWDGRKWRDGEVAFAGSGLYPKAYDYTGLITIDPSDPGRVYFSTNVAPRTGTRGDGRTAHSGRHEMYEGVTRDAGETWKITPITKNSPTDNLRPVCVAGEGWNVLLWLRGRYTTFTNYEQDVVGIIRRSADGPSEKQPGADSARRKAQRTESQRHGGRKPKPRR